MGINYDWRDGEEGFKKPTAGLYRFEVKNATVETSTAGNDYLKIECAGVGSPFRMWWGLHFTDKALRVTKPTLAELGVPVGLRPLHPHYFIGTVFDADCIVETGKPNKHGKVYDNLKPFIDSGLPGFVMGVKLVERSHNMPTEVAPYVEVDDTPF